MNLMVKFGNKTILNTHMNTVIEEIKRNEWTDNKIYKNATKLDIKPLFSKSEQNYSEFIKIQTNKECINNIMKSYFNNSNDDLVTRVADLKGRVEKSNSKDMNLTRKRNYEILIQMFKSINIDLNDLENIKMIKEEEIANMNDSMFLRYLGKYRNLLLKEIQFMVLGGKEISDLIKFLNDEERKANGIDDINGFDFVNLDAPVAGINPLNYSDNIFFNLLDSPPIKREFSDDKNLVQDILVNEFKKAINCPHLNKEQVMSYLQVTQDLLEAAKLYYEDQYGTLKLSLLYVYQDNTTKTHDFNLVDDPSELIMVVYKLFPNANDPKLYLLNHELIIPDSLKFIGGLNLAQNTKLIVKY
jgi:hypothetical protein